MIILLKILQSKTFGSEGKKITELSAAKIVQEFSKNIHFNSSGWFILKMRSIPNN